MTDNDVENKTQNQAAPQEHREAYKVLIVDDEPDFVEALRRTLESSSYQVATCSNRPAVQEAMKTHPSVIVLGTLAPAGETFAVYEWLERDPRYRNIPIMVIDARLDERPLRGLRRFEGLQMDMEDYASKPIEPASVMLRLRSLLQAATAKIRVLVTDDHTMVRTGICSVLSLQKDIEVVGEAADGMQALDKALRLVPNVALMDIVMPVMSGIEATKLIVKQCPETKVLILTQYDEEENMIVAKQSGAFGFIPKKAASSELLVGIRSVALGKYYPPSFAELIVK